jgi:site-specific recombinase XerD
MASVWRDTRITGRPVWCIKYKGLDLKWHREQTEAQNKDQAMRALSAKLREISDAKEKGLQTIERKKPLTFSEFVTTEYMIVKAPPARRESSHKRDKSLLKNVEPHFGPMLLGAITVQEIQRYLSRRATCKTRLGTPPTPAQMNLERWFLGAVLELARKFGYINANPCDCVDALKLDNQKDRVISPDEEKAILEELPEHLKPMFKLALGTGMRLGEILSLQWSAIDRRDGEAVLGGFIRIGAESKGHKARYIPINAAVKAVLDAQKPVQTEGGFSPFVFTNPHFKTPRHYTDSGVSNEFTAAAIRAKADDVTFHTTRHTAVSRMVEAGIPDRVIMAVTGHKTTSMVSRYAHVKPDAVKGATDCLAAWYCGGTGASPAEAQNDNLLTANGKR